MTSLGDKRLAGVPRRTDRLTTTTLGAGRKVEHLLPGEVLDQSHPKDGLLGHVLHVHVRGLVETAEGARPARGGDVERGQEDVQMLGVRDEDQEPDDHADVQDDEGRLEHAVHTGAQRVERLADQVGGERPPRVREVARVGLGSSVEEESDHHQGDEGEHKPGGTGVGSVETRTALPTGRSLPEADHREHAQRSQHGDGEEVFDETEDRVVPEAPDGKRLLEQIAVRLNDREEQEGETPEGEGVGKARHGPPQQLLLAAHLDDLSLGTNAQPSKTFSGRLARTDQPRDPPEAAASDGECQGGCAQPDNDSYQHRLKANLEISERSADRIPPAFSPPIGCRPNDSVTNTRRA